MDNFINSSKLPWLIVAVLAASILIGDYFKPVPMTAALSVGTTTTGTPLFTCLAEGRAWPARSNGMCFLSDKPR